MKKNIVYKVQKAFRPYIKRLIVLVVLLATIFGLEVFKDAKIASLPDQNGWRTWLDDGSYGQISIYFNHSLSITPNSIREYNYKIFQSLKEAALKEDGDELIYCYSAPGTVKATKDSKTVSVKAMGVGGYFFYLHPIQLIAGSYFDPESDMKDQIVIDEDTAWNLFGSSNIVGQAVYINNIPHYISGVVRRQNGKIAKAAGLDEPVIFVSFQTLVLNGTVDSSSFDSSQIKTINPQSEEFFYTPDEDSSSTDSKTDNSKPKKNTADTSDSLSETDANTSDSSSDTGTNTSDSSSDTGSNSSSVSVPDVIKPISYGERSDEQEISIVSNNVDDVAGIACYELIMPDSVSNYAANLVKEKLGFKDNDDIMVLDSRTRFSFVSLFNIFRSFPARSMQLTEFSYPYWENIARGWEDILAIVVIVQLILSVIVFLLLVWIVVSWYNNRTWRTRDIVKKFNDIIYDYQSHKKGRKSDDKIKKTS